ncbi:MAG: hypothetical protein WC558_10650 [Patulibacter sp.]
MRVKNNVRRASRVALVASAAALAVGAVAGSAQAATEYDFESLAVDAVKLNGSTETPFTQASGHPDLLRVAFRFTARGTTAPDVAAIEEMRDLEIELPDGVQGNPMATPRCSLASAAQVGLNHCPAASVIGYNVLHYTQGPTAAVTTTPAKVYNIDPPAGVTSRFAFAVATVTVFIDATVNDDGRYTITSKIRNASAALAIRGSEMVLFGVPAKYNGAGSMPAGVGGAGSGVPTPLLTMGSDCAAPQRVNATARSWQQPDRWISTSYDMPALSGCDSVPFAASLSMTPETTLPASPSGFTTELRIPQESAADQLAPANLKKVEVVLPEGVAVNPSSAQGLVGCTDAQARTRELGDPSCPDAAKVGTVKIDTPVLPGPLTGYVYVGEPKSQIAANGDMFRIFLVAKGYGVTVKQEGRLTPDPLTGQIRAVFDEIPQQPFERMTIAFNGGPRAPLTTPTRCGEHTTVATLTATTGRTLTSESRFSIACRDGLFGFAPAFHAGVDNILAGASSPLNLSIARADGQHALTGVNLRLPKGLLANLRGNLGQVVGTVRAYSGLGTEPFGLPGSVTLEGPYGDAPFSLRVVVPAKAGPYDLGDVVVRQRIYIDPHTAQVSTVSDPLPTILQGVPVQLQRLDLSIDKAGFMINPTSCDVQAIDAGLTSDGGHAVNGSSRFAVGGCRALALQPKLALAWTDKSQMKKGSHPGVEATVEMPKGHANLKGVKVTLPLTAALDPDNAKALCEAAAAAARSCPEASIVGNATAITPALDEPVSGPVYFVKGTRVTKEGRIVPTLPKLYLKLSGQGVQIDLHADSSVTGPAGKQKLETTFTDVPDVPIDSFRLKIDSGQNGILKATNDVCGADKATSAVFTGQNGRVTRSSLRFTAPECAPQVVSTSGSATKVAVRLGGIGTGRLTLSGSRVVNRTRAIQNADAATIDARPRLTAGQKALLKQGRTVRVAVKVTFKPTKGKAVSWNRSVAIQGVKRSAR